MFREICCASTVLLAVGNLWGAIATVTTTAASAVNDTGATLGGNVTSDGGAAVTQRGIVYSTAQNPTTSSGTFVTVGSGTGSFSTVLNGPLSPGTTYYARAFATNSAGTAYGSQINFTTTTSTENHVLFADDFSGTLSGWTVMPSDAGATWQIQNGNLIGDYTISAGSSFNTQGFLLLSDTNQPSGDWSASVDFTVVNDLTDSAFKSADVGFGLWVNESSKLNITLGHAQWNWTVAARTTVDVSVSRWTSFWDTVGLERTVTVDWNPSAWNTATLTKTGTTYRVLLNGTEILAFTDTWLNGAGKVGFHTYGTRKLDNFRLETATVPTTATISVAANPPAGGTVTGAGTFAVGSTQILTATANAGYTFTGWADGNTSTPRQIVVPAGGAAYTANFSAVNTPPTISDIPNQTVAAGATTGPLAFAIVDAQTAAGSLTLARSSSNSTLVPDAAIVFGGAGANRTVTVSPASGQSGTATITVTVTDEGGLTASDSFTVTVNPALTRIVGLSLDNGGNFGSVAVGASATGTLTVANTGTGALTVTSIAFPTGFSGNWSTATIAAGASQAVTVTLAPTAAQSYTGNIVVSSDATGGTGTIAVSGNGTNPGPAPIATHAVSGPGYVPGGTVTITNTIAYTGTATGLGWQVLLPAGWSYASGGGTEGDVKPSAGTTELLEWAWTTIPASPVTFTYTLNIPAGASGDKTLAALAIVRQGGSPTQVLATPDPLTVSPVLHHSADTNKDWKIGLLELTRVIELYNTRNGTTRTGCYQVQDGTEDGFAPDPSRTANATTTLVRHHSADTNRDGKISLLELTRVIELYNTRSGTTRTGQYHTQSGTEDGFAPGPAS